MKPEILEMLTWENIREIHDIILSGMPAMAGFNWSDKKYYTEVLNRLKEKNH